jgi:DNA-binding GntR family transcriptional regulator
MSQLLAATSLTQEAYARLRADLLACRLVPGQRLKINELCQALAANPSAVREALSRLTAEGLVLAEPQRGFRAAPISAAELQDLTAARVEIEALCLRRAVVEGDLEWEAGIVAAFHTLAQTAERVAGDHARLNDAWARAHAAFHLALVAGCGSVWLLRLRDVLYDQSERYRRLSVPLAGTSRDLAQEHRDIMQAVLARAADQAVALMTAHLQLTTALLLRGFERQAAFIPPSR